MYRRVLSLVATVGLMVGLLASPARALYPGMERGFVAVTPFRVLDTRADGGAMTAGETRPVHLNAYVPLGAIGVALNITAVDATEPTSISAWPADTTRPFTTTVSIGPGSMQSNSVLLDLSEDAAVDLYNMNGSVQVIVDVVGWFTGDFIGLHPKRVMDTRFGYGAASLDPGTKRDLVLGAATGVPPEATAVAVSATLITGAVPTTLALGPTGQEPFPSPLIDAPADQIITRSMVVGLSGGSLSIANGDGAANVILDITGWFRADGTFAPSTPQRVVETSAQICGAAVGPGETRTVRLTEATDVGAATVNIRATGASEPTFITVWRSGSPRPGTSTVNLMPGVATSNVAVVELGPAGQIDVFNNSGTVEITIDVIGTFRGTTPAGEPTPCPEPPPPAPAPPTTKAPTTKPPTTSPPTTAPPTAAPPPPSSSWQADMLAAINELRTGRGLVALTICGALNRSSQSYAEVLVTTGNIAHVGPDGSTLKTRVAAAGYSGWMFIGENLAAGQGSVKDVMTAWINSPTHLENLVKPEFRHVGFGRQMGRYQNNDEDSWFWVQNFGANGSC